MPVIRFGTLSLFVNGEQQLVAGDFTANLGTPKFEAQVGIDGHFGVMETPRPATIAGNLRDADTVDLEALLTARDVTVLANMANGKSWIFRNATQTGEGDLTVNDGTLAVEFSSQSAEEDLG